MTAPIVIKGNESGLQPLLRALEMRRAFQQQEQAFQLEQQKFDLDKLKQQKTAELTDEQILSMRMEREALKQKLDLQQEEIEGRRIGHNAIGRIATEAASQGVDFGSPEFSNIVRSERGSLKDPSGFAHDVLDEWLGNLRQEADTKSLMEYRQAEQAAAEATARLQREKADLDARAEVFGQALDTGLPLGQVAQQLHAPLSIDPRISFGTPEQRDAAISPSMKPMTEQVAKANMLLGEMRTASAIIEPLIARTNGVGFISQLVLTNPRAKINQLLAHPSLNADQQRLLQAGWQYASAWQYEVSGQQINEQEFARLMNTTFPVFGDEPETIQQKLVLQQARIRNVEAVAGQGIGAGDAVVTALEEQLNGAITGGWEPELVDSIRDQLTKARNWRATLRQNPNASVLGPPPIFDAQGNRVNGEVVRVGGMDWFRQGGAVDSVLAGTSLGNR